MKLLQVQGVFFRATTAEEAQNLGLVGWVTNSPTGSVKGEAQGDEEKLAKLKVQLFRVSNDTAPRTCVVTACSALHDRAHGGEGATHLMYVGCIADIPAAQGLPRIAHRQVHALF